VAFTEATALSPVLHETLLPPRRLLSRANALATNGWLCPTARTTVSGATTTDHTAWGPPGSRGPPSPHAANANTAAATTHPRFFEPAPSVRRGLRCVFIMISTSPLDFPVIAAVVFSTAGKTLWGVG